MAKVIEEQEEQEEITIEDVSYVIKFADAINGMGSYGITPLLLNQRLKDISLNQRQATETTLKNAIDDIKNSETVIQEFAQDFEIQSQPYRRLLSYLGNMLSFDMTYVCTNATKDSDYKSAKYRKDLDKVKRFFDRFDYIEEFSNVSQQLLRNETFFACPRFSEDKIILQELPSSPNYTLITARWDYGFVFDFNMNWFYQGGVDINSYPDFFIEKWNDFHANKKVETYKPSFNPMVRGENAWAYWQEVPVDVGWVWKMNPTVVTRVPYFTGMFLDLIQQPLMRSLQKSANMATAAKMLYGEIPLLKDAGTKQRDQFAISPSNLGKFMAVVKAAIGDAVKAAAAPLNNSQAISFPLEEKLYSSYLKTALATSGVNTNLIYNSDQKPNAIETQLSLNADEQLMMSIYPQFEQFLNYYVNKETKDFKFKFRFEGTNFFNNREFRLNQQVTLIDKGIVMPQKVAAAIGMNPFEMDRQMAESRAQGWVDNLTPIISSFQLSGKEDAGRPKKATGDLSEEGTQTRSDGGNIEKGGTV